MTSSYARAASGYDEEHERELAVALLAAIAETSRLSDANVIALRTAESASALITVLATILAMSPAASRSPTAIRHTIDELGKRLRRRVAAAEQSEELREFARRCFHGTDVAGRS